MKREGGPGLITTSRAYLTVGSNKFAFLVPDGFKWDATDPQKVTLTKVDASCIITVRLAGQVPEEAKGLAVSDCRAILLNGRPGARIVEEFMLPAADQRGPAFEVRWRAGSVERASRVAYIPLRAGIVEFSLDSSPEKFGQSLTHLNYLMLTFRASDPAGKLEATPLTINN